MYIQRHIELSKETNSNIFFWMLEQEQKTDPENLVRRTIYTKGKKRLIIEGRNIDNMAEWWTWLLKVK